MRGMASHRPRPLGLLTLIGLTMLTGALVVMAFTRNYTPDADATPRPATTVAAIEDVPDVAFLGDSYTVGTGATTERDRWTSTLARTMEWDEHNYGVGGTNYGTAGQFDGGNPYTDRVPTIVAAAPDMVIVSGGRNEMSAEQEPGIAATFQELRAGLPDADIVAVSPFWDDDAPYPDRLTELGEVIRAEVEAVGGRYLEVGNPLEGRPDLISDGVHPNDEGYALLAETVQDAL